MAARCRGAGVAHCGWVTVMPKGSGITCGGGGIEGGTGGSNRPSGPFGWSGDPSNDSIKSVRRRRFMGAAAGAYTDEKCQKKPILCPIESVDTLVTFVMQLLQTSR